MTQQSLHHMTRVFLKQNFKHEVYYERRGIKGIIEWWSKIKDVAQPEKVDLEINTVEKYDRVFLNGKQIV